MRRWDYEDVGIGMREEDCWKRRLWERDEGRRLGKGIWEWRQRKKTVGNGKEGRRLCENG